MRCAGFPKGCYVPSPMRGGAAVEAVVVLPIIFLLIAGLSVLGIFLLQFHLMNDVTQEAGRTAAHVSSRIASCGSLEGIASSEVMRLRSGLPLVGADSVAWSDVPVVNISDDAWDGWSFQHIDVSIPSFSEKAFSLMGMTPPRNVMATSSFMLVRPCV
jgi:hypothetical protein